MGLVSNVAEALSPAAIRQAFRTPQRVPLQLPAPAAAPVVAPVERGRIGQKGPPLIVPIPHPDAQTTLVSYNALDAEPQDWFRIMERADYGDTGPMIDMFSDSRDRDEHLDGVARKRAMSMMGRPIVFRPADGLEDDKEAGEIAKLVRRILLFESCNFRSMLTHLMQAPVDSYAVSPIRWTMNRDGEHVPHLLWEHANRFAFRRDTLELGYYNSPYRSHRSVVALSEHPDSFVAHVPMGGRSDYPWRRGAMRSAIIPSFIKRNGLKFWLTLAERFGMPQIYATVPEGEDDDGQSSDSMVAKAQASLKNIGRIWTMVVTEGISIDSIPGSGDAKSAVHKELIEWAEITQSVGLLGQNLTTVNTGGSYAATETHLAVAGDLHLADSVELSETITQQIVEPLVRYNWPGAPVPIAEISSALKQVFSVEDVREGVCSDDERRHTMGHPAKPDGKGAEYRRPKAVQVPAQIGPAPAPATPGAP